MWDGHSTSVSNHLIFMDTHGVSVSLGDTEIDKAQLLSGCDHLPSWILWISGSFSQGPDVSLTNSTLEQSDVMRSWNTANLPVIFNLMPSMEEHSLEYHFIAKSYFGLPI